MQSHTLKNVLIQQTSKGRGVIAARNFNQGETVVVGRRTQVLPERTSYSFQMELDLHVELDEPARLINHSCNPNTGVRNNQLGG